MHHQGHETTEVGDDHFRSTGVKLWATVFPTFQLDHHGPTDRPTDGRTDGRTDKASYRVACPQLKMQRNPLLCDFSLRFLLKTHWWVNKQMNEWMPKSMIKTSTTTTDLAGGVVAAPTSQPPMTSKFFLVYSTMNWCAILPNLKVLTIFSHEPAFWQCCLTMLFDHSCGRIIFLDFFCHSSRWGKC